MCERELETEQNCNILTDTLLALTMFLSRSPGLLNWRPGGPFYWVLVFSTVSCHQRVWSPNWSDFLSSPSYIIDQRALLLVGVTIALIQPIHGQGYNSDIPRPDAPVIYIGAFPILTARLSRRSIYNISFHESYLILIPTLYIYIKYKTWKLIFKRARVHSFAHSWILSSIAM